MDEALALLPGMLTPSLHESRVRLSTWMPFAQAAKALPFFTGGEVSEATVRRVTEEAGAAYVAVQTAAVEAIEATLPPVPAGPAIQLLSVDGAMVPLVHQEWAEGKTLALGSVGEPVLERGERVVHTRELSYCSRLTDAETCGRLALVDTHRRPDAVRILDFPHARGYVAQAGQAVYGEGSEAFTPWFTTPRQRLPHGDPAAVLRALPR